MKKKFNLLDITKLSEAFGASSIADDHLPQFLKAYHFDDVYETEDGSMVYEAGGPNDISIEFFHYDHPLKRTFSATYCENGTYKVLYSKDLLAA